MELVFDIPAPPPTANLIWRAAHGRNYLSARAASYYKLVALTTRGERVPDDWTSVDVEIIVQLTRKSGDVDNRIKPVLDALTRAGVWTDDSIVGRVSCELSQTGKGRTRVVIRRRENKFREIEEWRELKQKKRSRRSRA